MKKTRMFFLPVTFSLLLFAAWPSPAATVNGEVKLIASGNRSFTLQGYNLPNVGGIEAVIEYQNMTDVQVQRGSIIQNAPNPIYIHNVKDSEKKIIVAAVQAENKFGGTGSIATISFKPVTGKTGSMRLTKIVLSTHEGNQPVTSDSKVISDIASNEENQNSPSGEVQPPPTPTEEQTPPLAQRPPQTPPPASPPSKVIEPDQIKDDRGGIWLGSVRMPADKVANQAEPEQEQEEQKSQEQEDSSDSSSSSESGSYEVAETQTEPPPRVPERAQPGSQKFTAHKGLLDQFRDYKGELTPQALTVMVAGYSIPGVRQEPAMALSDGKTVVKVHLDLPAAGTQSPNFALKGAKLVSLKNDEKGKWVIEALPAKNTSDVRITALQDNVMTEIPLTVVQPVPAAAVSPQGTWDEATFALFLKDRGADKAPRFDLNGDGTRSFMDDYIYTVNHVIRNPKPTGAKTGSQQQPPSVQPPVAPAVKPVRPK